jgi:hypothetical protein
MLDESDGGAQGGDDGGPDASVLDDLLGRRGDGGSPEGAADGAVSDASAPNDASGSEPGAPQILSFGSNVNAITVGESVTLVAVVAMPGGLQDLVGGELTAGGDDTTRLGAFVATTQGTYSLELSWERLYRALRFEFTNERFVDLRATFFSNAGKRSFQTLRLRLHCDRLTTKQKGACGGICVRLDLETPCGSCRGSCRNLGTCTIEPDGAAVCTKWVSEASTSSCAALCGSMPCISARTNTVYSNDTAFDVRVACDAAGEVPLELTIEQVLDTCSCGPRTTDRVALRAGQTCRSACDRAPCRGRLVSGTSSAGQTVSAYVDGCDVPPRVGATVTPVPLSTTKACRCGAPPKT